MLEIPPEQHTITRGKEISLDTLWRNRWTMEDEKQVSQNSEFRIVIVGGSTLHLWQKPVFNERLVGWVLPSSHMKLATFFLSAPHILTKSKLQNIKIIFRLKHHIFIKSRPNSHNRERLDQFLTKSIDFY